MSWLSVISSTRRSGGTLAAVSAAAIASGSSASAKLRAEMLTDTLRSSPASRQRPHWVTAVATTQRVSGWMRPDTSASSMNSSGPTTSIEGWCQRRSASTPRREPAREWHVRLVLQHELVAVECAAQLGDEREPAEAEPIVLGLVGGAGHAGAVGLHERHDRPLQQGVGVVTVIGVDRDPRGAAGVDRHAFE